MYVPTHLVQGTPTYQEHQHTTVQIVYAATRQQMPRFVNILEIPSYNILIYCFIET